MPRGLEQAIGRESTPAIEKLLLQPIDLDGAERSVDSLHVPVRLAALHGAAARAINSAKVYQKGHYFELLPGERKPVGLPHWPIVDLTGKVVVDHVARNLAAPHPFGLRLPGIPWVEVSTPNQENPMQNLMVKLVDADTLTQLLVKDGSVVEIAHTENTSRGTDYFERNITFGFSGHELTGCRLNQRYLKGDPVQISLYYLSRAALHFNRFAGMFPITLADYASEEEINGEVVAFEGYKPKDPVEMVENMFVRRTAALAQILDVPMEASEIVRLRRRLRSGTNVDQIVREIVGLLFTRANMGQEIDSYFAKIIEGRSAFSPLSRLSATFPVVEHERWAPLTFDIYRFGEPAIDITGQVSHLQKRWRSRALAFREKGQEISWFQQTIAELIVPYLNHFYTLVDGRITFADGPAPEAGADVIAPDREPSPIPGTLFSLSVVEEIMKDHISADFESLGQ